MGLLYDLRILSAGAERSSRDDGINMRPVTAVAVSSMVLRSGACFFWLMGMARVRAAPREVSLWIVRVMVSWDFSERLSL